MFSHLTGLSVRSVGVSLLACLSALSCSEAGNPDDALARGNAGAAATGGTTGGAAPVGGAGGSSAPGGGTGGVGGLAGAVSVAGGEQGGNAGGPNAGGAASTAGVGGGASGGPSQGGSSAAGGPSGGSEPIKVWLAGDSTMQTCRDACPCGWGGNFDALFNEQVTVVNSAVGGRSIQTWLYEGAVSNEAGANGECVLTSQSYHARWQAMLDATTGMQAGDYLFIQFGINDGDRSCPRHVGTEAFKKYLGVMAQAAASRGAHAVFLTPVSSISCNGDTPTGTRGFVADVKAAATANGVPVIDLHQLSVQLYDSIGLCPNDGNYDQGEVGQFFCKDHTHFEAAGAERIAKVVAGAVKAQSLPLSAWLTSQ